MPSSKYPLESVAEARAYKAAEALRDLAAAARERGASESALEAASRRRREHEDAGNRIQETERQALSRGELRAIDLARTGDWHAGLALESARLIAHEQQVQGDVERSRSNERAAQETLASRRADVEVIAKDRERWDARLRKRTETREEEASLEAWRPKT